MKAIRLPPCSKIDLGGLAKGWAVGRLAAFFRNKYSVQQGFINAGGDIALWAIRLNPGKFPLIILGIAASLPAVCFSGKEPSLPPGHSAVGGSPISKRCIILLTHSRCAQASAMCCNVQWLATIRRPVTFGRRRSAFWEARRGWIYFHGRRRTARHY